MTRKEIKEWSKRKIKGNIWNILGAVIIADLIGSIISSTEVENLYVALVFALIGGMLSFCIQIGLIRYMINFITDKEYTYELLISKFKDWKQVIITYWHQTINLILWTLLFIIPGIVKGYAYSLVTYILADNSTINSKDALKLSEEMMKGHKYDLFKLELSFIGWHILSLFTFGLLEIWVIPYHQTAITKFLNDVKETYEKKHQTI